LSNDESDSRKQVDCELVLSNSVWLINSVHDCKDSHGLEKCTFNLESLFSICGSCTFLYLYFQVNSKDSRTDLRNNDPTDKQLVIERNTPTEITKDYRKTDVQCNQKPHIENKDSKLNVHMYNTYHIQNVFLSKYRCVDTH
jgi:hypothetical protein